MSMDTSDIPTKETPTENMYDAEMVAHTINNSRHTEYSNVSEKSREHDQGHNTPEDMSNILTGVDINMFTGVDSTVRYI